MLQKKDVENMDYIQLLANINEVNRPPGGKDSIRRITKNTFITKESKVLDVGCNTGYSSFEFVHLVKCNVIGVDISPDMISAANRSKEKDLYKDNLSFQVADGMNLPFDENTFDLTMSGGSTAFIDDKVKALHEYARVTKTWGFVADVNFYYKETPPTELVKELNDTMKINIQPWTKDYWLDIYQKTGLEIYHTFFDDVYVPSDNEVIKYCSEMSNIINATEDAKALIQERLVKLMSLFKENHRYLAYGVFILRKRGEKEQISLFGA